MSDWFEVRADEKTIRKEREKARQLRKSNWWKEQLALGICHYCGKKFPADELTMDHIVPVARGGKSVKGNIVPCCKECNSAKQLKTPVDMILEQLEREQGGDELPPAENQRDGK